MSEKKLTQQQLFIQYLEDEQLKIDSLDWSADGFHESQKKLIERFELLESIAFESKARATKVSKKLREISAAQGHLHLDKEGKVQLTKSGTYLPPLDGSASGENWKERAERQKKQLSKLEKTVKGFIDLGYTDDDIYPMFPTTMYKIADVRDAIKKVKEDRE